MDDPSLTIAFEAPETAPETPDLRVRLEAEENAERPTLDDLDAMVARAKSGMSARTVLEERCRAAKFRGRELVVTLAVLVWPSRADLHYDLDLPEEAKPGAVTVMREERRYKTWAGGGGAVELPWRMESARPVWAHGCWDAQSRDIVPQPALRHDQARIVIEGERAGTPSPGSAGSSPGGGASSSLPLRGRWPEGPEGVYGIVAASGMAVGYRHEFSLVFGQFDAEGRPQSHDIDSVPVAARWIGADGEAETAEIDIPVPECARKLLEACPNGFGVFSSRAVEEDVYEVAYSDCNGKMLAVRKLEDEDA